MWDRLFGTYTDPADARFPISACSISIDPWIRRSHRCCCNRSSIVAACLTRRDDAGQAQPVPPSASAMRGNRPLWQSFIGLVLAMLALWPTMLDLAGIWANSEAYQYAWLVIPMFACMRSPGITATGSWR